MVAELRRLLTKYPMFGGFGQDTNRCRHRTTWRVSQSMHKSTGEIRTTESTMVTRPQAQSDEVGTLGDD